MCGWQVAPVAWLRDSAVGKVCRGAPCLEGAGSSQEKTGAMVRCTFARERWCGHDLCDGELGRTWEAMPHRPRNKAAQSLNVPEAHVTSLLKKDFVNSCTWTVLTKEPLFVSQSILRNCEFGDCIITFGAVSVERVLACAQLRQLEQRQRHCRPLWCVTGLKRWRDTRLWTCRHMRSKCLLRLRSSASCWGLSADSCVQATIDVGAREAGRGVW